jgi:hypothetical protein
MFFHKSSNKIAKENRSYLNSEEIEPKELQGSERKPYYAAKSKRKSAYFAAALIFSILTFVLFIVPSSSQMHVTLSCSTKFPAQAL